MTITTSKLRKDIAAAERRLQFLRSLLQYMTEENGSVNETIHTLHTNKLESLVSVGGSRVGVRANILRKLHEGAAWPDDLYNLYAPARRRIVMNVVGTLRRTNLIRDTAKGRVELTTEGMAEAQWFVDHPTLTKRGKKASV